MAKSRYSNVNLLDKSYLETMDLPTEEALSGIACAQIRVGRFDRLDNLAYKHLGSGEYWWVIALINNLGWSFGFEEGQILKIPFDVQDVLKLF